MIFHVIFFLLAIVLHAAASIRVEGAPASPCAVNKIAPKYGRRDPSEGKTIMYFYDLFANNNNNNLVNSDYVPSVPNDSGCNDGYSPLSDDEQDNNYDDEEEADENDDSNQDIPMAEPYRPHNMHRPHKRPRPDRPHRPHRPRPPRPQRPHRPHRPHKPHRPRPPYPIRPEYPVTTEYPYRPDYPHRPQYPGRPEYPNIPEYPPTYYRPSFIINNFLGVSGTTQRPQNPSYDGSKPVIEELDDILNTVWRPTGIVGGHNGHIGPVMQDLSNWSTRRPPPTRTFQVTESRRRDNTGIISSFLDLLKK